MEQEGPSFIEELLEEAQLKEKKLEQAHIDLILLEIRNLNNQIEQTFEQANQGAGDNKSLGIETE